MIDYSIKQNHTSFAILLMTKAIGHGMELSITKDNKSRFVTQVIQNKIPINSVKTILDHQSFIPTFLEGKTIIGESLSIFAIEQQGMDFIHYLVDRASFSYDDRDTNDRNILHILALSISNAKDIASFFQKVNSNVIQNLNLINLDDNDIESPLHQALESSNFHLILKCLELFKSHIDFSVKDQNDLELTQALFDKIASTRALPGLAEETKNVLLQIENNLMALGQLIPVPAQSENNTTGVVDGLQGNNNFVNTPAVPIKSLFRSNNPAPTFFNNNNPPQNSAAPASNRGRPRGSLNRS